MRLQDIKGESVVEENANETARIVAHWKEHGKGMSDRQLADAIGNDLEQLEYNPSEAAKLIPHIVAQVKGS